MEHIGNTKIKKSPHPKTKTIGAYWVHGSAVHTSCRIRPQLGRFIPVKFSAAAAAAQFT